MTISKLFLPVITLFISAFTSPAFSQKKITGNVSGLSRNPLAYVNIGIKGKNTGTVSKEDGSFSIIIPSGLYNDSLTFSLVGYHEFSISIKDTDHEVNVILEKKASPLKEVVIRGEKWIERKYGIKKRGLIHFTDGIFKKDDSFEIGQVISLGNTPVQITSLNLYIHSTRPDSAYFRINFYKYNKEENTPEGRVFEKEILQRHPVQEGWLKFDLSDFDILLKGEVLAAVEFIPDHAEQIIYEVKLGGASKSFFRKTSLGQWTRPPHHYCLHATVLTHKNAPQDTDDEETLPAFSLKSSYSTEPFSFFVKLPKNYAKNKKQTWPVVYLLDGNAYFDPVAVSSEQLVKKRKISKEPIIVGIGYENAYFMDSLRNRDYTFPSAPPEDSFTVSGQGDKFYHFITSEVVKYIDGNYRTDTSSRTLMGHSFGGYFVLYAIHRQMNSTRVFKNFVAASPSISYHDYYIIKKMKTDRSTSMSDVRLYMTVGELEGGASMPFTGLSEIIKTKGVRVQLEILKNQEHMGTAIQTFENGIKRLF